MQIREGGSAEVEEIVAVTMGPESAVRALHKAVSLGADRSVHLTDGSLAGSDVAATGYALSKALESESPDLVLLGQQSDDGECYTIGAVVADHLHMPSLTQVIKMDVDGEGLRCERQAEYGYDTVQVALPAVISVGDAINEPRYPSLKAIMGAKKKPLDSKSTGDVGIDGSLVGEEGSRVQCGDFHDPPAKAAGQIIEDEDTDETAKVIDDHGHGYALFGGGLLGFEIGAGLAARKQAGVTMEVTAVKAQDGKLVAERPILQDSKISVSRYRGDLGIIIGRINAFETRQNGEGSAEVVDVDVEYSSWSNQAAMVQRG